MLRNTHEVVGRGKNQYIVFVDVDNDREVFIPTRDPKSEFESY